MSSEFQKQNPYVGPRPFERGDENIFFGREREVNELMSLIIAHRTLLLYAPSGAGKTSLLNAGLLPLLVKEGFEILPIARVRGLIPDDINIKEIQDIYVFNTLMSWAEEGVDHKQLGRMTLYGFLNERKPLLGEDGFPSPRLIIFDQFEELFTFYQERWHERESFFHQLAEALEKDSLLRVLFVIREDYLANFDPYTYLLPERLRMRYRLDRLQRDAACLAVEGPLKETGRWFENGVAGKLVQELMNISIEGATGETIEAAGEYVEPVQLQVVCQNLWFNLPPDVTVITSEHFQTLGDVDEALKGFYERAINSVVKETGIKEGDLRALFEQQLITPAGTRGTIFRGLELTGGITNDAVDALENQHIIRGEMRAGARWYELTHDRLIKPIQKSNKVWFSGEYKKEQQQRIDAERQRADKQQKMAEDQTRIAKRLSRQKTALIAVSLLIMVVTALALYSRYLVKKQRQITFSRELAAAAINNLDSDPERGILLAIESASIMRSVSKEVLPEVENALHRSVQASHIKLTLSGHKELVWSVAFSPDDKYIATASGYDKAKIWDVSSKREIHTLTGHGGQIYSVAFSPDGNRLATASQDKTAKIWDAGTGKELFTLLGHTGAVYSVAFSPDGNCLATASQDKTVKIWDAATGKELLALLGHTGAVYSVAFNLDGKRMATASFDKTAKIWDAGTGKELFPLIDHKDTVYDVAFSPDGKRMATASWDKTAKIWDIKTGRILLTFSKHTGEIYRVAFSPDGKHIATASKDYTIKVWDVETGDELFILKEHKNEVSSVKFSHDGKLLITGSFDSTAKVWDIFSHKALFTIYGDSSHIYAVDLSPDESLIATGSRDSTVKIWDAYSGIELNTLIGHIDSVWDVAFSPDGKRVATASGDMTAKIWDAVTGKELLTLLGHTDTVNGVAFSPDGKRIATASWDKTAKIWDATTGKELLTLLGHTDTVNGVAFSPDGKRITTASWDKTAGIWDTITGKELLTITGHNGPILNTIFTKDGKRLITVSYDRKAKIWDARTGKEILTLSGHTHAINDVAVSFDGNRFFTASWDGTAKAWDISSSELPTLKGHTDTVNGVAFSPDGKRMATASFDKTAKIWDAGTGKELFTLSGHTGAVYSVAFSPDGNQIATASQDKTTKVWDVMNGKKLFTLTGHNEWVNDVAFSPDGKLIVTASNDSTVKVWDSKTEKELHTLLGHSFVIRSVVFSPDGKRIATASADKTVKIWDTKTGKELLTHYGHNGWVNDVAFSPDGKRLITASDDKTARQYMNDIDELLVFARNSLTRALTIEECQKYLSMKECPSTAMAISKVVEGKVQAQTGNIDSAVEHLKTALKLDPSLKLDPEKEAKQQYAFVLLIRGIALINVNNKKEAVNYIKKAVETNPDEDTLSNAGAIYHEPLYEYEAAYMAFKQALNINPRNNSNIANFAEANLATGRFKDAYNLAQEILSESDASQPLDISTQLAMRFIIISSLVMQGLTAEAKKELMEFINFYNDISKSYKNEWNYTGTTHFIKERIMDSRQKKLLLKLIEILKTQQPSFITARQFEELIK